MGKLSVDRGAWSPERSVTEHVLSGTPRVLVYEVMPRTQVRNSYLVDPASSHMLVSKIKPCMSKYKLLYGETADGSLKQLLFT